MRDLNTVADGHARVNNNTVTARFIRKPIYREVVFFMVVVFTPRRRAEAQRGIQAWNCSAWFQNQHYVLCLVRKADSSWLSQSVQRPWIPNNWSLTLNAIIVYFFRLTRGHSQKFLRGNEDIWRVSTRTVSRRRKVVECHQSTRMIVASLKKTRLLQEAGGASSGEVWHGHCIFAEDHLCRMVPYFLQSVHR